MTLTMFTLNAFYGLALAMNMFIIASGLNLIFGVLRVINFAHGMFYMFGATSSSLSPELGRPFLVGVLAAAAGPPSLPWSSSGCCWKNLYDKGAPDAAPVHLRHRAADERRGEDDLGHRSIFGLPAGPRRRVDPLGHPAAVPPALPLRGRPAIAIAMWLLVDRTCWGRDRARRDPGSRMLAVLGVNVRWSYAAVFTIGSALAGVGGALAAPRGAGAGMDATIINECFIIVIIGGLGNL